MNNEKITETYDVLKTFIPKEDIYLNEPMSKHTTFKIGGNAKILVQISSEDEIMSVTELLRDNNVDHYVIGNGSNLLVSDNGYDGVIIEYIKDGEFDVLIKFADKADDRYYYCFKDEGCHIIYHRFLPEDYEDLQL